MASLVINTPENNSPAANVDDVTGKLESLAVNPTNICVAKLKAEFTEEEKAALTSVRSKLLQTKASGGAGYAERDVRPREVALVTLICKLRVDKAVAKFVQFMDVLKEYNLTMDALYEEPDSLTAKLGHKWEKNYEVCGQDKGGRSIMWISAGEPNQISEEQIVVHSGILYWMAVHSDILTLRDGCTFVIDTTKQKGISSVGNEKKLQKTWQSLPLRPQNLFIVGASYLKRLFINALIKFATVFSNSKVLARIRFAEMEEVREVIDAENMPHGSGGIQRQTVSSWVLERLSAFDDMSFV
jgi:hypothetical protein